jgi:phosphatidylglycerophosphate synthase
MFSARARERMLERGFGLSSFLAFFSDSFRESLDNIRANRVLAGGILRFSIVFNLAVVAGALPLYYPDRIDMYGRFALYTALSCAGFTSWLLMYVGIIRDKAGRVRETAGLANYLTMARFYLIVPVVVLFSHGLLAAALSVYVVLGLTDIADGVVARRRGEQTEFGTVMDPLADIFSTAAVFAAFLAQGLIPLWLFLILMLRYAVLIVGSFVMFLATGPIEFKATIPGKIVGILQGIGIIIIGWCVWRGVAWKQDIAPVLYPSLGLVFAGIVVSQAIIGYRHWRRYAALKKKAENVGS